MTSRVITRKKHAARTTSSDFAFTRDMVPGFSSAGSLPDFISDYRSKAWHAFEETPMPSTTDEPWRRTDLRNLNAGSFKLSDQDNSSNLPKVPKELLRPLVSDQHSGQIVLTPANGVQTLISPELESQGVIFSDLASAQKEHPDILSKVLGDVVRPDEGKFAALAGAMAEHGVLVYVPRGVEISQPLHSILWGPGAGFAYFSHILVWVEDGSSLTYIHEAASDTEVEGQTLHAGIVELHVGKGANLRFVELQSWGEHVWNFSHERARVSRDASLDWIYGAVGSHLTKNFSDIDLVGEGATGRMSGFYFTDGDQHLDHDTQQNHLAPNTTSDLLFKGALNDKSRSVWQGMIYVAPGAQKTDGYQANRNLTLSRQSRADSIPGLEILADDVRCTHGATVGKIDPEHVFYLRSRGIPYDEAERLIVEGFFDPIMQRIPFEGIRSRFQNAILEKMV